MLRWAILHLPASASVTCRRARAFCRRGIPSALVSRAICPGAGESGSRVAPSEPATRSSRGEGLSGSAGKVGWEVGAQGSRVDDQGVGASRSRICRSRWRREHTLGVPHPSTFRVLGSRWRRLSSLPGSPHSGGCGTTASPMCPHFRGGSSSLAPRNKEITKHRNRRGVKKRKER